MFLGRPGEGASTAMISRRPE